MKVFIANFGRENHLWPSCLKGSTIATFEDKDLRTLWLAGDREGYIAQCIATKKTAAGLTPTRPVASRWFNLAHIVSKTENELWIHREKDALWWTISSADEVTVSLEPAFKPARAGDSAYVIRKPANPWSNKNRAGNRLDWRALHPRAREFLFTEGTLQRLSDDNAEYAQALIDGNDLAIWHARPTWKAKEESAHKGATTIFNAKQRAVVRMAQTARNTVAGSNGQQIQRTVKSKELHFTPMEFEKYIADLIEAQEGLCAITGLKLQFDGEHEDTELLCSLDRIDSDRHYEPGNLQILCRFVNRWKNADNDVEFRRLLDLVLLENASIHQEVTSV